MAPLATHLVIGERVFAQVSQMEEAGYGLFLLGCVVPDAHFFGDVERRITHFADRLQAEGVYAFHRSCANFLDQLNDLLIRPWKSLATGERAFVAGYLCHLAADEDWKQVDYNMLQDRGLLIWTDLPVPGGVTVTAFDVLSSQYYGDFASVATALSEASVPDVLTHVSHGVFQAMWNIAQVHALSGSTFESNLQTLARLGKSEAEVQVERRQLEAHWDRAIEVIEEYLGSIPSRIDAMVARSLQIVPCLWERFPVDQ